MILLLQKRIYKLFLILKVFLFLFIFEISFAQTDTWKPVEGRIMSKWAEDVDPQNVLPEYPRPNMVRQKWQNLNGIWQYSIRPADENRPAQFEGDILVPFPVESALSGVNKEVGKGKRLWYFRSFEVPKDWENQRVILHFGAVDWDATVFINGREIGNHKGGYDTFSFDITEQLNRSGKQEIVVSVWDPTSEGTQPRGKQVVKPEGIWYTPVTGIWQTVWMEPVPEASIVTIKNVPDIDKSSLSVQVDARGLSEGDIIKITAYDRKKEVASVSGPAGKVQNLSIGNAKLWSPESPFLYDQKIEIVRNGKVIDEISSYFGMRKISMEKDDQGINRILLNNNFLFQFGTLDQGWWPDGLYTAPTDEALLYDIEITKKLGFNMIRKHVKVEPARWYYHCDKQGMLVWQDMPNGDESAPWEGPSGIDGKEMERSPESAAQFEKELKALIDSRFNYPSIVMWVPFNEGWGQYNTVEILNWTKNYDTTRLVNGPSGGNHVMAGHTIDHHQYPGPGMPPMRKEQALVLGEFGGLGLPLEGHLWQADKNWGYRKYETTQDLENAYAELIDKLPEMIKQGLSAAIYTQTTDVEGEVNGLMTYDRKVIKFDPKRLNKVHDKLFFPLPAEKALAPVTK
ncbi:glycoside hydrolase family 2 TIM barrel-domain containing protein [soil metagenome]